MRRKPRLNIKKLLVILLWLALILIGVKFVLGGTALSNSKFENAYNSGPFASQQRRDHRQVLLHIWFYMETPLVRRILIFGVTLLIRQFRRTETDPNHHYVAIAQVRESVFLGSWNNDTHQDWFPRQVQSTRFPTRKIIKLQSQTRRDSIDIVTNTTNGMI